MAGQAGAIRAGAAYVELFAKDNRLTAGLAAASAKLKAFGAAVAGLGARMVGIGALFGAPLVLAAKNFADMGSQMLDLSQRTGMSVEQLSGLAFAAEQSGASIEDLETAIKFMQRTMGHSDIEAVADELSNIADPAQRTARAVEIFGRAGTRMLPMLMDGAEGLRRFHQEAERAGLIMSTSDAIAAESFGDAISKLWKSLKMATFHLGSALAPALKDVAEWLTNAAKVATDWIKENKELVKLVGMAVVAFTGAGLALMVLGPAISAVGIGLGLIGTAISAVVGAVGILGGVIAFAASGPFAALVVGLAAASAAFVGFAAVSSGALSTLGRLFGTLGNIATTTFGGIADLIAEGDFAGAIELAGLGMRLAWLEILDALKLAWRQFARVLGDGFHAIMLQFNRVRTAIDIAQSMAANPLNFLVAAAAAGARGGQREADLISADIARANRQFAEENQGPNPAIAGIRDQLEGRAAQAADDRRIAQQRREAQSLIDLLGNPLEMFGRAFVAPGAGLEQHQRQIESMGTFSGAVAGRIGVGSGVAERTANATEQTAANTRRMAGAMEAGGGGLAVI